MESDEAKALKELAKLGSRALDSGDKLGAFLSKVFGTVPSDVIGVVGGDWLHHIRIRNAVKLSQRTEEILQQRGISDATKPMSPSIALPILVAAQDETREEIRELWARMLANGMDPKRRKTIRQLIIATVKQFDPLDAVILQKVFELSPGRDRSVNVPRLIPGLSSSIDEIELSMINLEKLECIMQRGYGSSDSVPIGYINLDVTALGREVLRATIL